MGAGVLYVVSTPIGNLEDITFRAISTLKSVDLIAAEDTRHTGKLLKHYEVMCPMVSYHEHNELARTAELMDRLAAGQQIALVSDAGTPAISDPGYRLISAAVEQGFRVVPLPGANAALAGLVASGLPTDRFLFEGFLPKKKGRNTRLEQLAQFNGTVVIYESPMRVIKTLGAVMAVFGERKVALCRELTKRYETILTGTITELLAKLDGKPPKGECVIVIGKAGL